MKFFAALALILPVVSAFTPTSTTKRELLSLNPDPATLSPAVKANEPVTAPETNAQRLRRGLNPLAPRNLRHHGRSATQALRPRQSQGVPTQRSGHLHVRDADGVNLGYLSYNKNQYGEYLITADLDTASFVSFSAPSDGSAFHVSTSVGSATYPFLGAVAGFASTNDVLGPGSYDYAYIAGVHQDATQGPPLLEGGNTYIEATGLEEASESVIWSFDAATGALSPQWTNPDGSENETHLLVMSDGFFVITGDVDAFTNTFGAPKAEVRFFLTD